MPARPASRCFWRWGPPPPPPDHEVVQIRLSELSLRRPRQWGCCWLARELWDRLEPDAFWSERLPPSRNGTRWLDVFKTPVFFRLLEPGSEWRLHRQCFEQSAVGDLLGGDLALVQIDKLYRCLDKRLVHREAFFSTPRERWRSLFGVSFDVLLYGLTSTYFEIDPPSEGKRQFGYSRTRTNSSYYNSYNSRCRPSRRRASLHKAKIRASQTPPCGADL